MATQINWGGIVKGALIVTAVAVACVGVGWAASYMTGYSIAAHGTVAAAANGLTTIASTAWALLSSAAAWVWGGITALSEAIGLTGAAGSGALFSAPAATAQTAAIAAGSGKAVGLAVGGGAALLAAKPVMNSLHTIPTTVDVPTPSPDHAMVAPDSGHELAATKTLVADSSHAMQPHDFAYKVGAHAADHGDYQPHAKKWTASIAPRDTSHAAQADMDKTAAANQQASVA